MAKYKFVMYTGKDGEWRWRLVSTANGQSIASPGQGFSSKQAAIDNIERVKMAHDATIEEE